VAFQDVVSKSSGHASEYQARELKGKPDIGGKMFSFNRYLKREMNAGEDRARLSREHPRSLGAEEHLRVVKGQGPCQCQLSMSKEDVFFI